MTKESSPKGGLSALADLDDLYISYLYLSPLSDSKTSSGTVTIKSTSIGLCPSCLVTINDSEGSPTIRLLFSSV